MELKVTRDNLEKESKTKNIKLKNLKIESQNMISYSENCLAEIMEKEGMKDDLHNKKEMLRVEKERLKEH